jgi:ABC-type phosphate transport system substrate-binding protein
MQARRLGRRARGDAMRQAAVRIAALAFVLGCAGAQTQTGAPTFESPPTTNAARQDIVIQFDDMTVQPAVARVKQGGKVAWTSVASDYQGVISFPLGIVDHFTCKELRPDFVPAANRLVSIPVATGQENLELPCPLKPGTYQYRIDLTSGGAGYSSRITGAGAQLSLDATLIVE